MKVELLPFKNRKKPLQSDEATFLVYTFANSLLQVYLRKTLLHVERVAGGLLIVARIYDQPVLA